MKQDELTVVSNRLIAANTFEICLRGDVRAIRQPGQFLNLKIPGFMTRRPLSICDLSIEDDRGTGVVTLIYKIVGDGTQTLARIGVGEKIDCLIGLGTGFNPKRSGKHPLLIGGGVGAPPLFLLARTLIEAGTDPTVIMGFNSADEIFYEDEFRELGCEVVVTTADGSSGVQGLVTTPLPEFKGTYIYACGPNPMLAAIAKASDLPGEFSFEERMGCGFGACMGCVRPTVDGGYKRMCVEGPVMKKEELVW